MEKTIQGMAGKVRAFHDKILGADQPAMDAERWQFRSAFLREEITEADDAFARGEMHEVVDGLVDLVYVALGALLEMGVPPDFPFDAVHDANMKKERGMTRRGVGKDAVKPAGWTPPDHRPLMERVALLQRVSPIFVEITKLRESKGKNYNRGTVRRAEHFPLGHLSYFQMVWIKAIRLRSLVESIANAGQQGALPDNTVKLIDRELNDLMAYGCFWAEWSRGMNI